MKRADPTKKSKGRPPKYVLDEEGKEVVGLSYNHTNNMYYATGTKPRHYICNGSHPKEQVLFFYRKWKENHPNTPEEVEEQRKKNEIHELALRLIEEGFLDDLIEKKARQLIRYDENVREELFNRAKRLITREPSFSYDLGKYDYVPCSRLSDEIEFFVTNTAKSYAGNWIREGIYDKELWERAYDLITSSPIRAAKILGIPEIAYVKSEYGASLSWCLAWDIFYSHKSKSQYLYDQQLYRTVEEKMTRILDDCLLSQIKLYNLDDALTLTPEIIYSSVLAPIFGKNQLIKLAREDMEKLIKAYSEIPMLDRLKILKDVFETVKKAGYDEATHILQLIRELSNKL